jgi:hypothetical protein
VILNVHGSAALASRIAWSGAETDRTSGRKLMATTVAVPPRSPGADRFLIGILAGIGVLLLLAMVAVFLLRQPVMQLAADTPGGTVQGFLQALERQEYDRTYGYLAESMANKPTREDFTRYNAHRFASGQVSTRMRILLADQRRRAKEQGAGVATAQPTVPATARLILPSAPAPARLDAVLADLPDKLPQDTTVTVFAADSMGVGEVRAWLARRHDANPATAAADQAPGATPAHTVA